MKRNALLFSAAVLGLLAFGAVSNSDNVSAATYFGETTEVANPVEGDTWFRNVGDGNDTLSFTNGAWTVALSTSARRVAALEKYKTEVYEPSVKANEDAHNLSQTYLNQAIADPEHFSATPEADVEYVLVIGNNAGNYRIPKVEIPAVAEFPPLAFVSAELPVMLPVIGGTETPTEPEKPAEPTYYYITVHFDVPAVNQHATKRYEVKAGETLDISTDIPTTTVTSDQTIFENVNADKEVTVTLNPKKTPSPDEGLPEDQKPTEDKGTQKDTTITNVKKTPVDKVNQQALKTNTVEKTNDQKNKVAANKETLPQAGEKKSSFLTAIGLALASLAGFNFLMKRKPTDK